MEIQTEILQDIINKGFLPYGLDEPYRIIVGNNPVLFVDPWGLKSGDIFKTRDGATIDAIDLIMNKSSQENREYGGFIYENKKGEFSYTEAVRGNKRSHNVSKFNAPPEGTDIVAVYHTHPGTDYLVPYFSTWDYMIGNEYGAISLGTESGLVKEWSPKCGEISVRGPFGK